MPPRRADPARVGRVLIATRRVRRRTGQHCTICRHELRYEIELALVSGVATRAVAKKFAVSRDAAWRHLKNHVDGARRAQLVAGPMRLQELAEKATAEGLSLLDYLVLVRSTLVARFLAASESDDRPGTALLAGRLIECLRLVAQVTGELQKASASVTNNTLIMASPIMGDLQNMLMTRLKPYPDALQSVVDGLEELSARTLQGAAPAAPLMLTSQSNDEFRRA